MQVVTAIVYMDGSFVNNSMVASDSQYSMTGYLNLQFASDSDLIPATNTALREGGSDSDVTYTKVGEFAYPTGSSTKVSVYYGSNGKFYYQAANGTYQALDDGQIAAATAAGLITEEGTLAPSVTYTSLGSIEYPASSGTTLYVFSGSDGKYYGSDTEAVTGGTYTVLTEEQLSAAQTAGLISPSTSEEDGT
jgi:hypothetical protein